MSFEFELDDALAKKAEKERTSEDLPKILCVDDEPANLEVLHSFLKRDYHVFTATNGHAGLKLVTEHEFDVIISDQRMPQMLGTQLLTHARELSPDTVRIILTGHADVEDIIASINSSNVHRYVVKPWAPEDMRITVKNASEKAQLQKANTELVITLKATLDILRAALDSEHKHGEELSLEVEKRKETQADLEVALAKAEEASRLKSEFLANISHELQTPLNCVINAPRVLLLQYTKVLVWHCDPCDASFVDSDYDPEVPLESLPQQECPDCNSPLQPSLRKQFGGNADEHFKLMTRVHTSGKHLSSIVSDLLDYSTIEAGRMEIHVAPTNLSEILAEIEEMVVYLAEEKSLTITYPKPDLPLMVPADATRLKQVVLNLLSNAVKFTEPGGRIDVTTADHVEDGREFVAISVLDEGCGIAADKLDVIFESFRQADGSHTRKHGGTGLGLAICRRLVELHGGKIWVTSEIDTGSSFSFTLPRLPNE